MKRKAGEIPHWPKAKVFCGALARAINIIALTISNWILRETDLTI